MEYKALKPEPISLVETVKALRQQRHPWMVEGESQYTFAYVVILHLLKELACQTPSKNESKGTESVRLLSFYFGRPNY